MRHLGSRAEAVNHAGERPLRVLLLEDVAGLPVGVASVDDQRQAGLARRSDVGAEALDLLGPRAVLVVEVEAGLADADAETGDMLEEEYAKGAFRGLIHCFSAGPEVAHRALALGLFISISGIVTFKAAEELRTIVRHIPIDRLLVETDAPYLAPVPKRGKTNEPAFVAHTAAKVAELKGVTLAELEAATTENFFRLFAKAERPACG